MCMNGIKSLLSALRDIIRIGHNEGGVRPRRSLTGSNIVQNFPFLVVVIHKRRKVLGADEEHALSRLFYVQLDVHFGRTGVERWPFGLGEPSLGQIEVPTRERQPPEFFVRLLPSVTSAALEHAMFCHGCRGVSKMTAKVYLY